MKKHIYYFTFLSAVFSLMLFTGCRKSSPAPSVLYWFWSEDLLENDKYLSDVDSIAELPFNMVFLTAREGAYFYDFDKYAPAFAKLVDKAHSKGIQIGLQLWTGHMNVTEERCKRMIGETSLMLDSNGEGEGAVLTAHVRDATFGGSSVLACTKNELYHAWAFIPSGDGTYQRGSLKDITGMVKVTEALPERLSFRIDGDAGLSGHKVYVLAQQYYRWNDIYCGAVSDDFRKALEAYSSIPFDGMALDEFSEMHITPPWKLEKGDTVTERYYSPAMEAEWQKRYEDGFAEAMLAMRYCPDDSPETKIRSINRYMDLVRSGPVSVERTFVRDARRYFGKDIFIGFHSTFHNRLTGDEIWQTGGDWWTLPRFYGQTDEESIISVQMGIAQCSPARVMYNMYYHPSADTLFRKATEDLQYRIRTHWHAYNDRHGYGVSMENRDLRDGIARIEKAAELLDGLDPALPQMDVLAVCGMEALQNWFPDKADRTPYMLNGSVDPEDIVSRLWSMGFRISLISSDVIADGLCSTSGGEFIVNGHKYKNVIWLYPQYCKADLAALMSSFEKQGGRLAVFGPREYDFDANRLDGDFGYGCNSVDEMALWLEEGEVYPWKKPYTVTEDGVYIQTFWPELPDGTDAEFSFDCGSEHYSGICQGMIALQPGRHLRVAAIGLKELRRNGELVKI